MAIEQPGLLLAPYGGYRPLNTWTLALDHVVYGTARVPGGVLCAAADRAWHVLRLAPYRCDQSAARVGGVLRADTAAPEGVHLRAARARRAPPCWSARCRGVALAQRRHGGRTRLLRPPVRAGAAGGVDDLALHLHAAGRVPDRGRRGGGRVVYRNGLRRGRVHRFAAAGGDARRRDRGVASGRAQPAGAPPAPPRPPRSLSRPPGGGPSRSLQSRATIARRVSCRRSTGARSCSYSHSHSH